jgi:predicted metal-dependent phosphoesterase TrpH
MEEVLSFIFFCKKITRFINEFAEDLGMDKIIFEKPKPKELRKEGFLPVDMHIHTKYSDGINTVQALLKKAGKKGFGVAVTDHNCIKGALDACNAKGVFAVPGIEITTCDGPHLLCYFYNVSELVEFYEKHIEKNKLKNPNSRIKLGMAEISERLRNYNCILSLAHPCGYLWVNLARAVKKNNGCENAIKSADAVEVLCGLQSRKANLNSIELNKTLNKGITAGSDAHSLLDAGSAVTCAAADNVEDFLEAIELKKNFVVGHESRNIKKILFTSQFVRKHSKYWPGMVRDRLRKNEPLK